MAETSPHWDALRVIWNGRALNTMGGPGYAAVGAVLGSQPGAEFLAAADAAKEVGAVVSNLDADVTMARVFADSDGDEIRPDGGLSARRERRRNPETETEAEAETRAGENDADADDDEYVRLAASREGATIRTPTGRSARRRRLSRRRRSD